MSTFATPMMKQYGKIKKQYQDCLLFFRMGDFYELFMEDAYIGSQVLNITLTSKSGGKDGKIPMAGVPYHAVDAYLPKLVKAGYKVAICEQVSLPNKYGLVDREVVRIVTPGTILDEKMLEKKENNYIISILLDSGMLGIAAADLSTGYFGINEIHYDSLQKTLQDEISQLQPSECILPDILYNDPDMLKILKTEKGINIFPYAAFETFASDARTCLRKHFGVATLESFGIEGKSVSLQAAAALLGYLKDTQKGAVSHIKKITSLSAEDGLLLDRSSMINLELFSTIREHDTKGSLLAVLDETKTAMGGRLLRQWMKKPLAEKEAIEQRLEAVNAFVEQPEFREILRDQLKQIPDIERLLSRLAVNLGNARDVVNLKSALQIILQIKELLQHVHTPLLDRQSLGITDDLKMVIERIETVIVDEPPIALKEGGLIKPGISEELDKLRKRISKSKTWIMDLERSEKEVTGIGSLKVRYNKVFGFYIEVSKANLHLVPENYTRKQTLVNGERFITAELKEHEEIILSAEEKMNELEYKLFLEILDFTLLQTEAIQNAAQNIAVLDCIANFAYLAEKHRYIRPRLLYSGEIRIKQGRHPVVEKLLDDAQFVANDVTLDNVSQQLLLITGPNMAGKSVFIRQVALIVLMAQMGCFVPALSAHISVVDRIFVRSGASDVITSGLSTFMVEMVETAHILNNATKNSLIIMDEIGRGTSTYDGISIAWAVAEYLVKQIKPSPKTLFATHYHELQALEEKYPNQIRNFHMAVAEQNEEPIFLHTVLPGGASHSFGVAVAKLAGVPEVVIKRATDMLHQLENRNSSYSSSDVQAESRSFPDSSVGLHHPLDEARTIIDTTFIDHLLHKELENLDIGNMTPIEALNKLAELKDKLKLFQSQADTFLEAD